MNSGKISKKLLKKLGLSQYEKEIMKTSSLESRISDGRDKHRSYLQDVKNDVIKQEIQKGIRQPENPEIFNFRREVPDYSSFKSLITKRNWDEFDLD